MSVQTPNLCLVVVLLCFLLIWGAEGKHRHRDQNTSTTSSATGPPRPHRRRHQKEDDEELEKVVPFHYTIPESDYRRSYHLTKPRDTCNLEHSFSYNVTVKKKTSKTPPPALPPTHPPSIYDYPPEEIVKFKCVSYCEGIGDVLKGIVSSALLAVFSNHKFEMVVQHPPLHHFYTYPPSFVVTEPLIEPRIWRSFNRNNRDQHHIERVESGRTFSKKRSYVVHTNANYIMYLLNSVYLPKIEKVFGVLEREHIFGCVLRYLLKPTPRLLAQTATILKGVNDGILIGLHIRTGDRISKRTPVEMIESFFECYRNHLGEKAEQYYTYLAVDKAEMYKVAQRQFNSSRLLTFPSFNNEEISIGHSDKCRLGDCDFVRERTIVEHFLLSTVDSLITSWSGFSTTAAQIGGHYDSIAIGSFCDCVKGRTIRDFMETKNGRKVPIWTREKCERYNPGSTLKPPKPSKLTEVEEEEEQQD